MYVASARETLATPLTEDQYGIPDDQAVFYVSIVISGTGLLSIIYLMIVTRVTKNFDSRKVMIFIGFVPVVAGMFLHYPMGTRPIVVANCSSEVVHDTSLFNPRYYFDDSPIEWIHRETTQGVNGTSPAPEQCYGCPYEIQPWCLDTPQITPVQLILSFIITTLGFGVAMSYSQSVYTRILGPIPLGVWLSILAACSAVARITGPIWSSHVYESLGTTYTYIIFGCLESVALAVLLMSYRNLAPMAAIKEPQQLGYDNEITEEEI